MKIHKVGYNVIFYSFMIMIFIIVITNLLFQHQTIYHCFLYFLLAVFFLCIVSFFRYPKREININDNNFLSPADGKIVVIEEVNETEYYKDKRIQISIFMSTTNVHQNKYPVSGIIKYVVHHPGKYLVAWNPKASLKNERVAVVVENEKYSVLIRQIAGAVARRIVCNAKINSKVIQGEELGFIKFGSRVDLLLPLNSKIKVKLNQKVVGGKTIIANYK